MEGFNEILTLLGGTSPLVALAAWHMFTMHKAIAKLTEADEKVSEALHAVRERLVAIETRMDEDTAAGGRRRP